MTDKHIINGKECRYWFRLNPSDYRKCSLSGENDNCDEIKDCFVKELLGKLALKEQECEKLKKQVRGLRPELKSIIDKICCKYNIEAKNYHEKIIEIINNLDEYKQTLAEIKPILEFYANSNMGEEQPDKTYHIMLNGSYIIVYDPKPARQALQKISECEEEK